MTNAPFSKILLILIASVALACAPHEALAQRGGRGFGGGGAFHGGGFRGGFGGVSGGFGGFRGGFGGFRGGFGRFGAFGRPFFGPGFRGSFGFGFGFGLWPYYSYYPYYPYYWCDPYGSYSCGPVGYSPYVNYPVAPPPAAPTGSQIVPAPSTGNAYDADGKWHHFGESPGGAAPASPATAIAYSRTGDPTFTRNVNIAEDRWHRFSESR